MAKKEIHNAIVTRNTEADDDSDKVHDENREDNE